MAEKSGSGSMIYIIGAVVIGLGVLGYIYREDLGLAGSGGGEAPATEGAPATPAPATN